ncbi:MAG: FAD-binding oxidoreductase [Actinomycetota bacterium]|nr:FAD-binding oxidoreductase [Actinomycetota bacterium]
MPVAPAEEALAGLQKICGDAHARPATQADAVDGVLPSIVVAPASTDEVHGVLLAAGEHGLRVVPRGSGSKLGWGAPPSAVDLVLDMTRMAEVLEHTAGDLVARVQAGAPLAGLQERVAGANQVLALDPPEPGATLGGIIAANASGPRRLLYGTMRDLLIGVTVVLGDGTVAKAGGKVVKNVAGYDLGKLFTGSLGTLGVITEAIVRLHPAPVARRVVTVDVDSPEHADRLVQAVIHSQLVPSAVELSWPAEGGGGLAILLEGIEPGVEAQASTASALLGGALRVDDTVPGGWDERPYGPHDIGLKISAETAALAHVLDAVATAATSAGLRGDLRSSAGSGISYVGLAGPADPASAAPALDRLRSALAPYDGSVVVLQAPPDVKAALDVWGPVGDALPVMRRVKDQFDPDHRMSPGRFVGGI